MDIDEEGKCVQKNTDRAIQGRRVFVIMAMFMLPVMVVVKSDVNTHKQDGN